MKNKIIKVLVFALVAVMLFGTVSSFAFKSYDTYTYDANGAYVESPMAYKPALSVSHAEMHVTGSNLCSDIFADVDGYIYVVDSNKNRIVVMNETYDYVGEITTYVDEYGKEQTFNSPDGIFVTNPQISRVQKDQKYIYVADTGNKRVVVFDQSYNYVKTILKPDNDIIADGAFQPQAVAVDIYGRIFISSTACYEGIIVLSPDGEFNGFIGAQKISYTIIEMIFNRFKSAEDRANELKTLPVAYNNITVDNEGFIYASITFEEDDRANQLAALTSKDPVYSPVKKFNSMGDHILNRNGFFDPSGEVSVFDESELSNITDIALGAEGAWTILDKNRARTYTYDKNGNLLYAFGDIGMQLGSCASSSDMTYQAVTMLDKYGNPLLFDHLGRQVLTDKNGNVVVYDADGNEMAFDATKQMYDSLGSKVLIDDGKIDAYQYEIKKEYRLILLDNSNKGGYYLNVYIPTDYANAITTALYYENTHNHHSAVDAWRDVLTLNNNLDLAYIGIGRALYYQGEYAEAMEMLEGAYDTEYWSLAYAELRKGLIGKLMLVFILVVIALLVVVVKFLGWAKKKNKAVSLKVGRKTYLEELLYAFHLVFHPFDGFWDLKHEKRGSVRAASTILLLTIVAFFYNAVGQGYSFAPRPTDSNILIQVFSIAVPVILWTVANWCLTTLFEGEGSMKDIYIATCYSLSPLPVFVTIATILTNVLTASEAQIVNLLITFAAIWMVILLFFGMLVTHDYSMGKNFLTVICSILAAAVIIFVIVLFAGLVTKMYTFVDSIITEISTRV